MIKASSNRPVFEIVLCTLLLIAHVTDASVMDNRYFPWLDHMYTGADQRQASVFVEAFALSGGDAYRHEDKAIKEEQIVGISELCGMLKLADVATSMEKVGLKNPIPADWRFSEDIKVDMRNKLEGQGFYLSGYAPITNHFGIGGSTSFMRLNSFTRLEPHEDTVKKLNLSAPGNQALFTRTILDMYQGLGINSTHSKEIGMGDTTLYLSMFNVTEYRYKFRKIDWGAWVGLIIPSGVRREVNNLGSLPFGGDGLAGWFISPRIELELKDDWKCGISARLTKRFDKVILDRIPVGSRKHEENCLLAPVVDYIGVNTGTTWSIVPYFVFEDVQGGFGVLAKYTVTLHEEDRFSDCRVGEKVAANFTCKSKYSGWVQEYATVKLFYDISHNRNYKYQPIVSFTWDIPRNHMGGKGFAKTNKISLTCNINF